MEEPFCKPVTPKPPAAAATAADFANYPSSAAASATHFPSTPISEAPSSCALLVRGWKAVQIIQQWIYSHHHGFSAVQSISETHLKVVFLLSWSFLLRVDCVKSWKHQFTQGDKWWAAFVWSLGTAGKGWDRGGFKLDFSVCSSQKVHFTSHLGDWHLCVSSPCATAPGNNRRLKPSKDVPDPLKGISHDRNGSSTNTINVSYTISPHYMEKKLSRVSCKSVLGIHFSCFSPL